MVRMYRSEFVESNWTAIKMLKEAETELEVPDFRFTAAKGAAVEQQPPAKRYDGSNGGSGGRGSQQNGGETEESKAMAVYAREKQVDRAQVNLDRVKKDGGVAKWAAMWGGRNPDASKPKAFQIQQNSSIHPLEISLSDCPLEVV